MTQSHDSPLSASEDPEILVEVIGSATARAFHGSVTIGRAPSNDVVVDDRFVSKHHAEIRLAGDQWEIRDLRSTNGTFVDGKRVDYAQLGPISRVRLGHAYGPELLLRIPPKAHPGTADAPSLTGAIQERYLGEEAPENMSEHTRLLRTVFQRHRQQETHRWRRRTLRLWIAIGSLLLAASVAGGVAYLQHREAQAGRAAAAEMFHTIKSLELDIRRLESTAGTDESLLERHSVLEQQYQDLLTTLGIYSDDTREDVRLIYQIVHKFGESEANVPPEFVDEVLRYIEGWKRSDLKTIFDRARENDFTRRIASTLLEHNLPPEFFYLALQESAFDTQAVGPLTRFGYAKGMWQFIPMTAEQYGLQPGPLRGEPLPDRLDDRHDFDKSTSAAARYLYDIYTTDAQASGLLVMASYNWGERNVIQLIKSLPESPRERNFWNLLEEHGDRVPEETYDYVFRIVSAAVIGENPRLFGFDFDPPLPTAPASD